MQMKAIIMHSFSTLIIGLYNLKNDILYWFSLYRGENIEVM